MFERLSKDGRHFEAETKDHINNYAEAGLRTLVVTYRDLNTEEYKIWEEEFSRAKTSLSEERDVLLDATTDKIERDLILLGATAVEDKLQKGVRCCNHVVILWSCTTILCTSILSLETSILAITIFWSTGSSVH